MDVQWQVVAIDVKPAPFAVGHAAENVSTLRRPALNPANGEKSLKIGVAAKRKRAGWDLEYPRAMLRLAQ